MSESLVRALLKDRPIAYKPLLAKALGGVTVGLWMSQLIYWSDKGGDPDGWIYKTRDDWADETAMGIYEVTGARKRALALGVIEEKLARVPACLHYRVRWDVLEQIVSAYIEAHPTPQTTPSIGKNPILELGKTQNKSWEKPNTITETTTETTTEIIIEKKNEADKKADSDSVPIPADFGAVLRLWEQSAGLLSKTISDQLGDLVDDYGASMVHEALLETVKQINRPKMKYLEAVLQNWRDKGRDKQGGKATSTLQQIEPGVWRG